MFCTNCGVQGSENYCADCGTPLKQLTANAIGQLTTEADWRYEVRYESLLQFPEVRERLAKCASRSTRVTTGEEWLTLCDAAFKPLTGVSIKTVATIAAPVYARIGIRTGKTRVDVVNQPTGHVIVNVLCALAEAGLPLSVVHQCENGSVIESRIPSDVWSFEGQLVVTVERTVGGTRIEAATNIPGQWFDWGKSARCLEQLFGRIQRAA